MLHDSVEVKIVGLQAMEMYDLPAPFPARVTIKIVGEEVIPIIRNDCDRTPFAHGKRIHDDFVRESMETFGDGQFQIFEVVDDLSPADIKAPALYREHARVDPS